MVAWTDIQNFLTIEFTASAVTTNTMRCSVEFDNGRSHYVDVAYNSEPYPYLHITSPIADFSEVDLVALLKLCIEARCPYGVIKYIGPYASLDLLGLGTSVLMEGITGQILGYTVDSLAAFSDRLEEAVRSGVDDFVAESLLVSAVKQRLSDANACPRCGSTSKIGSKFCGDCGAPIS